MTIFYAKLDSDKYIFTLYQMSFPGFWKRLKKTGGILSKIIGGVNSVYKTFQAAIETAVGMIPVVGSALRTGILAASKIVDKVIPVANKFLDDKDYRRHVGEQAMQYGEDLGFGDEMNQIRNNRNGILVKTRSIRKGRYNGKYYGNL